MSYLPGRITKLQRLRTAECAMLATQCNVSNASVIEELGRATGTSAPSVTFENIIKVWKDN